MLNNSLSLNIVSVFLLGSEPAIMRTALFRSACNFDKFHLY